MQSIKCKGACHINKVKEQGTNEWHIGFQSVTRSLYLYQLQVAGSSEAFAAQQKDSVCFQAGLQGELFAH